MNNKITRSTTRRFLRSSTLVATSLVVSQMLAACNKAPGRSSIDLANRAGETVGCQQSFEDAFWDGLYDFALREETLPPASEIRSAFIDSFAKGRLEKLDDRDRARVVDILVELYELLAHDTVKTLSLAQTDHEEVLAELNSLEVGDRTTPEKSLLQDKIREKFAEVSRIMGQIDNVPSCPPTPAPAPGPAPIEPGPEVGGEPSPEPTPPAFGEIAAPTTLFSKWKAERHPAVYGGLKALATAYQSCEAGEIPSLSSSTPSVKGIKVTGTHSNGVGSTRIISDLSALLKTQPYLKDYRRPSSGCFDVLKKPMIYDYGGKPYVTTADNSTLDFFKNAGSGTSELGIDCSGYVYSALATAGLKVKKSGRLKAINVKGIPARMYMNPQSNGMTCLDYAKFSGSKSVLPGDILASSGHVLLIASVGSDPFGIASLKTEADCKSSNIKISRFDFTVLQSSPTKGGIGIDRIRASEYLKDGGSMATAMVTHAVNACLAKVRGKSITTKSSSASLVRHSGSSECRDTPVRLGKEECVSSCSVKTALVP